MTRLPEGMDERRHGRSARREAGRSGDKSNRLQKRHGVATFGNPFKDVKYKVACHPERSEGPFADLRTKVPRCARDDNFALHDNFTLADGSQLPLLPLAALVAQAAHAAQP